MRIALYENRDRCNSPFLPNLAPSYSAPPVAKTQKNQTRKYSVFQLATGAAAPPTNQSSLSCVGRRPRPPPYLRTPCDGYMNKPWSPWNIQNVNGALACADRIKRAVVRRETTQKGYNGQSELICRWRCGPAGNFSSKRLYTILGKRGLKASDAKFTRRTVEILKIVDGEEIGWEKNVVSNNQVGCRENKIY